MTGDIVRFNHEGEEITAAVLAGTNHIKCLVVSPCDHGYKCRTRVATFNERGQTNYYCLILNKKRKVIRLPKETELYKIAHVCRSNMKFLLNEFQSNYARPIKDGKSHSSHTSSGSAFTSIYYTGQKISGGYNTHKG